VHVDTKSANAADLARRIGDAVFTKLLLRMRRQRRYHQFFDLETIEWRGLAALEHAVHTNGGRFACDQQEIAAATFTEHRQPRVKFGLGLRISMATRERRVELRLPRC
jgi:hypothetical protein